MSAAQTSTAEALPARRRLNDRRDSAVIEFDLGNVHYRAQFSRFPDGRLGELFLDGSRLGSAARIAARDGAVAASLAIQFGCPVETLQRALLRDHDGAAGPVGRALDIIEAAP